MEFSTKAKTVELRSDPKPNGDWHLNRGVAPGGEYTMVAHTDEERLIIEPLFSEFAATVTEELLAAGLVSTDAADAVRALRDAAAATRARAAGWLARVKSAEES
jgi:hypothetical protein